MLQISILNLLLNMLNFDKIWLTQLKLLTGEKINDG